MNDVPHPNDYEQSDADPRLIGALALGVAVFLVATPFVLLAVYPGADRLGGVPAELAACRRRRACKSIPKIDLDRLHADERERLDDATAGPTAIGSRAHPDRAGDGASRRARPCRAGRRRRRGAALTRHRRCRPGFPLWLPGETAHAGAVDLLFIGLLVSSGLVLLLLFLLLLRFAIHYRAGNADADRDHRIKKSWHWEVSWTAATLVAFLGLFVWGAQLFVNLQAAPKDALPVYVVAKQWMWKVQHPGGQREINELHVPLGPRCG